MVLCFAAVERGVSRTNRSFLSVLHFIDMYNTTIERVWILNSIENKPMEIVLQIHSQTPIYDNPDTTRLESYNHSL